MKNIIYLVLLVFISACNTERKLEDQKLWQNGQVKLYQINLSEIVREYIENQVFIPALESTTIEIIESLKKEGLPEETINELRGMLELSDQIGRAHV